MLIYERFFDLEEHMNRIVFYFVQILPVLTCVLCQMVRVCRTYKDYYLFPSLNKNCYYNPDIDLSVPEIIRRHGYPVETHPAITDDGYILTVFRIPWGKTSFAGRPKPPVFLQHGLALNCAVFVNKGLKSLAFILADAGYDVWLGNFRGNLYSKNHTSINPSSREFWDFSLDELGLYDLPAQLNLVSSYNNMKIIYIGYSMGTTTSYIYSSSYPDDAYQKIKVIISIAPVAFVHHAQGISKLLAPIGKLIKMILLLTTNGEVELYRPSLIQSICLTYPFQLRLCEAIIGLITATNYKQTDPETLPVQFMQDIDNPSVKTLAHYAQIFVSQRFERYDYDVIGNLIKYNSFKPPSYNLSAIKVPIYLITSHGDILANDEDVNILYGMLPTRVNKFPIFFIDDDEFTHLDYLWAKDIVPLCYNHIVNFIHTYYDILD